MGFFSGIVGGLLGGGKSKTVQTSTNTTKTDVDVEVQNVIDLNPIAATLESISAIFAKSDQDNKQIQKLTLATLVFGAQEQERERIAEEKQLNLMKLTIAGGAIYWLFFRKKKGKKK